MRWILLAAILAAVVGGLWVLGRDDAPERTGREEANVQPEATDAPEPGAPVEEPRAFGVPIRVLDPEARPIEGATVGTARTDAEGRCRLALRGLAPWVEIVVDHPDFVRTREWVRRQATEQDVMLMRGARLTVVVLAPDKSPVAGAAVDAGRDLTHGVRMISQFSTTEMFGQGRTGEDGRVVVGAVAPGAVTVHVRHKDFADKTSRRRVEGDAPVEHLVVLDTGGIVTGRVFDRKGEPVAGATVTGSEQTATTGADGTYRLEKVPVGVVRVVATKEGHGPGYFGGELGWGEPVPIAVRAGALTTGIDIHLDEATWLTGRLVDDQGVPVADAAVGVWHRKGFAHFPQAATDAKGRFRAGPLSLRDPTRVTVFIEAAGFTVPNPKPLIAKPGASVDFGKIKATRLGEIRGRVIDKDGKPVQAFVNVVSTWSSIRTDADGSFVCAGLRPGKAILTARTPPPDVQRSHRFERDIGAGEIVEGVELHLLETGSIRGRVVDPAGNAPPGVTVVAMQKVRVAASMPIDAEGRFEFKHLPVGVKYRVGLNDPEGPDLLRAPAPVDVQAGAHDLEFVVAGGGGAVTGKVVTRNGQPVPEFTITLIRYHMLLPRGSDINMYSGGVSRFRMEVRRPGTFALDVSGTGSAPHRTAKFSVAAGETKDLGTIKLGDGGRIEGTVRDAAGQPVPYARINILNAKLQTNDDAPFTDEEGRYEVPAVSPGLYTVFALTPNRPLGMVRAVRVREGKATRVDVTLLAPAPLTVTVTDRGGNPIPGAELSFTFKAIAPLTSKLFRSEIPPGAGSHVADEAGLIHQRVLPPGEVMITIEAKGFRQRSKRVRLKEGEQNRVTVRLERQS